MPRHVPRIEGCLMALGPYLFLAVLEGLVQASVLTIDFEDLNLGMGAKLNLVTAQPYAAKLEHYFSQNILAKSLHTNCYKHNPGFVRFIEERGLPFEPVPEFKKASIDARGELYRQIAKCVWDPASLLEEVS